MPVKVQVKMIVPLDQVNEYLSEIIFCRWLPGEEEALIYTANGFTVRYWTDFDCLNHLGKMTVEEIPQTVTIRVGKVHALADFVVENEGLRALAEYCSATINYSEEEVERQFGADMLVEYYAVGRSVYNAVMSGLNRLLGYIRAKKGHYWLEDYPILDKNYASEFLKNEARIRFDGGQWLRLRSKRVLEFVATFPGEERLVTQEDWDAAGDFVQSTQRVPIVGHLLSIAEKLSDEGHRRTALIEAVSALEVALHEFGRRAESGKPAQCKDVRTGFSNLKKHIEHLGLTGSINYLLPLILEESEISREVLAQCQGAIEERNNVAHNGQRDVQPEKLWRYLQGIRSLCQALDVV